MAHKIFFNLECTQPSGGAKRHGGGIYGEIVLRRIAERGLPVVAFYNSEKWLNPDVAALAQKYPSLQLVDRKGRSLQEVFDAAGCDVVFSPIFSSEADALQGPRHVNVVHGLRNLELRYDSHCTRYGCGKSMRERARLWVWRLIPNIMRRKFRKQLAGTMAHEFVVVSRHTAQAVKVWYPELATRDIKVFYSPCTVRPLEPTPEPAKEKYILMVSGNRWEKNIIRAAQALDKLYDQGQLPDVKVKITGLRSLSDVDYRFRHPDRFEALGYVDDDVLARLYAQAWAFLYPTLNEGFGYPPLEAMHAGVPVAASAVCSIPEVCGDAVLYFTPYDVPEIANRVLQLAEPAIRQRLSQAGRERFAMIKARQDADLDSLIDYLYD